MQDFYLLHCSIATFTQVKDLSASSTSDRGQRAIWLSYNLIETSVSQHLQDRVCQGLAADSSWKESETKRLGEGWERAREEKRGLRESERERASSACWTLTACEASIIHAAVHMSRAHRQAQQQGRAQIKQRIHGQCPQCTWRNTPRRISLLFSDKQRTRLPEHCLILLKSQELLE